RRVEAAVRTSFPCHFSEEGREAGDCIRAGVGHWDWEDGDSADGFRRSHTYTRGSREGLRPGVCGWASNSLRRLGEAGECEGADVGNRDRWCAGGWRQFGCEGVFGDREILECSPGRPRTGGRVRAPAPT